MTRWTGICSLAFVVATGCKPHAGSSCDKGESRCQDRTTQLACQNGSYVATPCRGPGGCALTAAGISCDISKNRAGDRCSTDDEGAAICKDQRNMLVCRSGQYRLEACRGPDGCQMEGTRAKCDTSVALPGDTCKDLGSKACSVDGKQLLACTNDKMTLTNYCRGQDGCHSTGGQLSCDMSVAGVGDPCTKKMADQVACSTDKKSIVKCQGDKFVVDEKCTHGKSCSTEDGSIACHKKGA
jgi:hypothetical protein